MKSVGVAGAFALSLVLGLAWSQPTATQREKESLPSASSGGDAVQQTIIESAAAFDDAYNAHDASKIAQLFAERGEMIDDEGVLEGRTAIAEAFTEHFTTFPKTSIRTEVQSVRNPVPGIAIEEGRTFVVRSPGEADTERSYLIIHAKQGDAWRIVSAYETALPTQPRTSERLEQLSWLVGDWIDESDDSRVETHCRWSDDGNWLLQDYVVQLASGPEMSGTQRIGWDPTRGQVRSWSFDSEGGFIEGAWTFDGSRWIAQVRGVAADGAIGSATRIITPLGADAYLLQSVFRELDGESLPDNEVTVVRRPPVVEIRDDDAAPEKPERP